MSKSRFAMLFILSCSGCASYSVTDDVGEVASQKTASPLPTTMSACPGDSILPAGLADQFTPVTDEVLLQSSLGLPKAGKLCQGRVYKVKENTRVTMYRAWNSTNPNSRMGHWWAFKSPRGLVAQYRFDYEICYQWSPLDKMTICTLNADSKVVIGTGQSAECSPYLTYPASAEKQIYIPDAASVVSDCTTYEGNFSWKAANSAKLDQGITPGLQK